MAGDWIKLEHVTPDKPEVWQIAMVLNVTPEDALGRLLRVWIWADQQSLDGHVLRIPKTTLDAIARRAGFADAMEAVGWLIDNSDGTISFPNFQNHNGNTAKTRARNTKNQGTKRAKNVTEMSPPRGDRNIIPRRQRADIYERDGHACRYCGWTEADKALTGDYVGAALSLDHVIPVSQDGTDDYENLVTCCTVCNRLKGDRTPEQAGMELSPLNGDSAVTFR